MENLKRFCKEKSIDFFFPIALILAIVPLIVRLKRLNTDSTTLAIFGSGATTDLFSQSKFICLMFFSIICIIISLIFFKKIFEKKDKTINLIVISAVIFLILTFLSALFSQYKQAAFWGMYDRAEGFLAIACYMVIFIYSIYTFKNTENYKFILIPLIILVLINGFLGLFQYFGQDLLNTSLGKLIANVGSGKISLQYESGRLYGTLFHYNYVGSFAAIVIPILLISLFTEDDVFLKIMLILTNGTAIWLLLGSTSRAGLLGIAASIIIGCILFGKILFKNWKPFVIGILAILIILIGANFATHGKIFSRIPSLVSDATNLFKNNKDFDYTQNVPIKDVKHLADGSVEVVLQNNSLKISYENGKYVFKDSQNQIVNYNENVDSKTKVKTYTTDNQNFSNISFRFGPYLTKTKDDGLLLNLNNEAAFMFNLKDNNSIHLINGNSKKDIEVDFPETIGFNGKEKLASARGYIWSRSLPLLKENLLLGSGPDTFVFRFPQNDLIGKLYAYGNATTIVDKPHNLYLQIALNEGCIALLVFLLIVIVYIIDSMKLYALKHKYTRNELIGSSILLGVIGYLFAGIFNDSVISVAPVFWIILGVGVAVNFMNRNQKQ